MPAGEMKVNVPASIRDVARLAKVSPGTVSKVLNNLPGIAVQTRERVLRASEELDYRPNRLVRGIFGRRSSPWAC